jgi:hypothetical protein
VIAVVWYRPEQWERVRDIAADAEAFEESYVEWLEQAEEKFAELQSMGMRIEKVDVDSEKLILWCNEHNREIDGNARTEYAAERLRELDQKRSLIHDGT